MTLVRLAEAGPLAVDARLGPGTVLVVAFASIGHDPTRPPSPEFVGAAGAGGRPALFVTDAARGWGLTPGLAPLLSDAIARIAAAQTITRIVGLGASMGGVAALRMAGPLGLDAVLAIGPQSRPAAPTEGRWRDWTRGLDPDLATPLPPIPWTVLLHGMQDDAAQAMGFAPQAGVDHVLYAGLTHSALGPHLKARGVLTGLVDALADGDRRRLIRIATGAGGRRRQLPR